MNNLEEVAAAPQPRHSPPTYEEATRGAATLDENPNVPLLRSQSASRPPRSRGNSGASRHAPPQAPQSNSRARRERPADTAAGPAVREEGVARGGEFNMTKYIMVCTGSGRWYCCCCMLFCWGLLGLGVAIMYFALTIEGIDNSSTYIILCAFSGMAYISFCFFWCLTICTTQVKGSQSILDCCRKSDLDPNTNYTVLSCALCTVIIFFMTVAGGLVVNVVDDISRDGIDNVSSNWCVELDSFCLESAVALLMWGSVLFCLCCNCVSYFLGLHKAVGRVFRKC